MAQSVYVAPKKQSVYSTLQNEAVLRPWEKMDWNPEYQRVIFNQWALFHENKGKLSVAIGYYNQSLLLKDNDPKVLYHRSMCKRKMSLAEKALKDCVAAAAIDEKNAPIDLEIGNTMYELNNFEYAKCNFAKGATKYKKPKAEEFYNKIYAIDENIKDTLGDSLQPFIQKNKKIFPFIAEIINRRKIIDDRPLWKINRANKKCDVLSLLERQEILLSPREIAQSERGVIVSYQRYLNKNWIDVLFIKNLEKNPNLKIRQFYASKPLLKKLLRPKIDVLQKFVKMLHARSPLYNETYRIMSNRVVSQHYKNTHVNRVQYQTRRNMITILSCIRQLRLLGKIEDLSRYVEEVMGDYIVLKTNRVMPWKFEFINEVYNTVALAHADQCTIPVGINKVENKYRLLTLLRGPIEKVNDYNLNFVFGNRSTYHSLTTVDDSAIRHKVFVDRLKKRMGFAKFPIERCYLYFEIARSFLNQGHLDICCSFARKACEEAKYCNSSLWQFISIILMCKSHAVHNKIEAQRADLLEAFEIAKRFKSEKLIEFVEMCLFINDVAIDIKRRTFSTDSILRRRIVSP